MDPVTRWWGCVLAVYRGGICQCRHCRRQCKIFASGVNFSIFTHFFVFFPLKLLKLGEIDGVKFLARKSDGVRFLTNSMSVWCCESVLCGDYSKSPISSKFVINYEKPFPTKSFTLKWAISWLVNQLLNNWIGSLKAAPH